LSATVQNAEIVHSTTLCKPTTTRPSPLRSFVTRTVRGPICQLC